MKKLLITLILGLTISPATFAEKWAVVKHENDVLFVKRWIDLDSITITNKGTKTVWIQSVLGTGKNKFAKQEWDCRLNIWHVIVSADGNHSYNGEWHPVDFSDSGEKLTYKFVCP